MDQKKIFKRIGLTLFIVTFMHSVIIASIIPPLVTSLFGEGTVVKIFSLLICDTLTLLLCWAMLKPLPLGEIPAKRKISVKKFFAIFCIVLTAVYLVHVMTSKIIEGLYNFSGINYSSYIDGAITQGNALVNFFTVVIFAPIFEELLFRKLLFEKIRPYGIGLTIFITALSFGLFHGNLEQIPYTFVMGLAFGYWMALTGDIRIPILAHAINNGFSWIGSMIESSESLVSKGIACYLELLFPVIGVILLVNILVKNSGQIKLPKEITTLNKSDVGSLIKTPGYMAFIILQLMLGIGLLGYLIFQGKVI